jgi:hypothetical protein
MRRERRYRLQRGKRRYRGGGVNRKFFLLFVWRAFDDALRRSAHGDPGEVRTGAIRRQRSSSRRTECWRIATVPVSVDRDRPHESVV